MSENNTDQADEQKESAELAENSVDPVEQVAGEQETPVQNSTDGVATLEIDNESAVDPSNESGEEEELGEEHSGEVDVNIPEDFESSADEAMSITADELSNEENEVEAASSAPKEDVASVDVASTSQGVARIELELISSNLESIEKEISALQNPTDQQLDKAKKLILMLSGVTGIVLVASITFFIVMSVSIAQKVDDLDRVLMAVAKRGIQLADGIETIAGMESKLGEVIGQNEQIIPGLSGIETQITSVEEKITGSAERTRSTMQAQGVSILESQDYLKSNLNEEVSGLEALIKKSVKLKPLEQEHSVLKRQLEKIDSSMTIVEAKVQDLYVIKQAEIETAYKGLSSSD